MGSSYREVLPSLLPYLLPPFLLSLPPPLFPYLLIFTSTFPFLSYRLHWFLLSPIRFTTSLQVHLFHDSFRHRSYHVHSLYHRVFSSLSIPFLILILFLFQPFHLIDPSAPFLLLKPFPSFPPFHHINIFDMTLITRVCRATALSICWCPFAMFLFSALFPSPYFLLNDSCNVHSLISPVPSPSLSQPPNSDHLITFTIFIAQISRCLNDH